MKGVVVSERGLERAHLSQEQQRLGTLPGLIVGVSLAVMEQGPLQLQPLYREMTLHHHDIIIQEITLHHHDIM